MQITLMHLMLKDLALERLGKYDEANQYYNKVKEIYAFQVKSITRRVIFLENPVNFGESIKSYDRVIDIDANNVIAWYNKGLAFSNLGKYDEAILCYNKVHKNKCK